MRRAALRAVEFAERAVVALALMSATAVVVLTCITGEAPSRKPIPARAAESSKPDVPGPTHKRPEPPAGRLWV